MTGPVALPLSGSQLYGGLFWPPYLGWLASEAFVLSRRRAGKVGAESRDRHSVRWLRLSILLSVVSAFTSANLVRSAAFAHHRPLIFAVGLATMLAGIALRWWAVRTLGRFFTIDVAVHPNQPVIQTGPYRWLRHPAYAGTLLTLAGVALSLGTWLGLVLVAVFATAGVARRIRLEEAVLGAALGAPYRDYAARTARLVPWLF